MGFALAVAYTETSVEFFSCLISGGCYQDLEYYRIDNCLEYFLARSYTKMIAEEERQFPLAYGILMYKNVCQLERLLQAIWRPSNLYCVHIDADADPRIKHNVKEIAKCFKNVFVPFKLIDVTWPEGSILEADMICMKELFNHKENYWGYYLNLNAHEYPLKTNLDIVRILKILNGANSISAWYRYFYKYESFLEDPPPFPVDMWKGEFHTIACRGFVDYALHNSYAQIYLDWLMKRFTPDDGFYNTLNFNPQLGAPGAYLGSGPRANSPYFHRLKHWDYDRCPSGSSECTECGSDRWIRNICIFGVRDLKRLTNLNNPALFLNKFYWDIEPYTFDCLEKWHFGRVDAQYKSLLNLESEKDVKLGTGKEELATVNYSFYKALDAVHNHLPCYPFQ